MNNSSLFHPFNKWTGALLLALAVLHNETARAYYQTNDVVTNFTFTARQSFTRPDGTVVPVGGAVRIKDFAGRVVFLEWFAVWCPYCVAAAPQVGTNIVNWYAARGGNPYGVPVLHIAVNQEANSAYQTSTDNFVSQQGFNPVVNDYTSTGTNQVRFLFQPSGQPIFAVINCVTNSPSHQPWQVLVNYQGYGQTDFNTTLAGFRAIIDTVQAGVTNTPPPVVPSQLSNPHRVGNDFEFTIQTQPGLSYQVLGSTNLANWLTLQTINATTNTEIFHHTNAPAEKNFYRVVTP